MVKDTCRGPFFEHLLFHRKKVECADSHTLKKVSTKTRCLPPQLSRRIARQPFANIASGVNVAVKAMSAHCGVAMVSRVVSFGVVNCFSGCRSTTCIHFGRGAPPSSLCLKATQEVTFEARPWQSQPHLHGYTFVVVERDAMPTSSRSLFGGWPATRAAASTTRRVPRHAETPCGRQILGPPGPRWHYSRFR